MNQESPSLPRISVAMATYNGGPYLREQLASIFAQDSPPEEIIVCDDGSTDDTPALLTQLHSEGKIRFFRNETQLGVTGNFKRAVSLCKKGNFIALSDQDDFWKPEKLRINAALLAGIDNTEHPALVFSDLEMTDENMLTIQPSFWNMLQIDPQEESLHSLLFGNIVTGCTTMFNPAMAQVLLDMPEDAGILHDVWMGLAAYSFGRVSFSGETLVRYRQHGANVTFDTNKRESTLSRTLKNLRQVISSSAYLQKELATASLFFERYSNRMTAAQQITISNFLRLSGAGFLRKKNASLRARSYRYKGGR